ncbi:MULTISPECIES: FMN-binding protein [Subtercola]|uniref:FMN-binding protein n=1 Tax=Subtercola vilae TaxID=2056433 RepID=A0A4T2C9I1_9MICO|nr:MULTISPECIES: FMN-binding protein [Subtercola]MEA9983844.1 FMN-binding protein [Subtercola sp. RTI3]TIH40619.1 FMN-binding protein [Subtercola vilae]
MRRRAVAASIVSSGAVILLGWQIGTQSQAANAPQAVSAAPVAAPAATAAPASSAVAPTTAPAAQSSTTTAPAPAAPAAPAAAAPAATPAATQGAFTGSAVSTRYGTVQVQITVSGGKITDVTPLHLTDDGGRSVQISNQAAPILRKEVLAAQSANVDSVSGATYTTDGYLQSLQSALDQAKM